VTFVTVPLPIGLEASLAQSNDELVQAIADGKTQLIKDLLTRGVHANACGRGLHPPLMSAVETGNTEVVRLLLEKGADVNVRGPAGLTALMLAAANGHPEIVRQLRPTWTVGVANEPQSPSTVMKQKLGSKQRPGVYCSDILE